MQDAVIIGGGFYGAVIARYLVRERGLSKVTLIEKESALLSRASHNNQARVHNGYHYPRSFTTAYRSRVNFPNFVRDWPQCIRKDFTKIYAIAKRNSKVTSKQFQRFCVEIGAQIQPASMDIKKLFESRLIEDIFSVQEYSFDSSQLAGWAQQELKSCGVQVLFNSKVTKISKGSEQSLETTIEQLPGKKMGMLTSRFIFNCSYSGLNQISGELNREEAQLKHEITEMALLEVPSSLSSLGITVMDGPFFSLMPFPEKNLHTLSHVRYTPHLHWADQLGADPYEKLKRYNKESRVDRMIRDVSRYIPDVAKTKYVESLFEIKTVLAKNEIDDGRPILFQKHSQLPGFFSILGGKIDNIYDVLLKLDAETIGGTQ
jgi:glycine/D-amino acid oxidase-like deaminating enzyme